jgi:hypothetical protein
MRGPRPNAISLIPAVFTYRGRMIDRTLQPSYSCVSITNARYRAATLEATCMMMARIWLPIKALSVPEFPEGRDQRRRSSIVARPTPIGRRWPQATPIFLVRSGGAAITDRRRVAVIGQDRKFVPSWNAEHRDREATVPQARKRNARARHALVMHRGRTTGTPPC